MLASSTSRHAGPALCGLVLWLSACAAATTARVVLVDGARFELEGLDPVALSRFVAARPSHSDWQRLFLVRVAGAAADAPAVLGRYEAGDGVVSFVPKFAPEPGLSYRVIADLTVLAAGPRIESVVAVPERAAGPARTVAQVYPSGDALPENLLRFYVQFSGPMTQGVAYEHSRLLDRDGKVVELAFLEIAEELWDRSGTRLTLLIDPGRIKTGLRPRVENGPVLIAGRSYTLVIDASWPDANGNPMARGFEKRFSAAAADTGQPDPERWKVAPPRAGTRDALEVELEEPLDHGCLHSMIDVVAGSRGTVEGEIEVAAGERVWRFVPRRAWGAGEHTLVIDTDLEDRCGNSIRAPFEVDLVKPNTARIADETKTIRFVVD